MTNTNFKYKCKCQQEGATSNLPTPCLAGLTQCHRGCHKVPKILIRTIWGWCHCDVDYEISSWNVSKFVSCKKHSFKIIRPLWRRKCQFDIFSDIPPSYTSTVVSGLNVTNVATNFLFRLHIHVFHVTIILMVARDIHFGWRQKHSFFLQTKEFVTNLGLVLWMLSKLIRIKYTQ